MNFFKCLLVCGAIASCVDALHMMWPNRLRTLTVDSLSVEDAAGDSHEGKVIFPETPLHLALKNQSDSNASSTTNANNSGNLYCAPEEFMHDVQVSERDKVTITNRWQSVRAGQRAGLQSVCLLRNGLPLTRKCLYNAQLHTVQWEDIAHWPRKTCVQPRRDCMLSTQLNELHTKLLTNERTLVVPSTRIEFTAQLHEMLRQPKYKLLPADVHYTAQILHELTSQASDVEISTEVLSICSTLMSSNANVLRLSAQLNATNSLLESFETFMDTLAEPLHNMSVCGAPSTTFSKVMHKSGGTNHSEAVDLLDFPALGVHGIVSTNLSVFYLNPKCADITGIAVYALDSTFSTSSATQRKLMHAPQAQFSYRFIYMEESADMVMQEAGLELATFVPKSLWNYISNAMGKSAPTLVFKIYAHDGLFVEPTLVQTRKPFSKILSISIPNYKGNFPQGLPFMLRNHRPDLLNEERLRVAGTGCSYWNYNTWVTSGVDTQLEDTSRTQQPVILCSTNHLTQFSYLMGGAFKQHDPTDDVLVTPIHERALDIISLVGCSLSILGLLFIWLTAVLVKSWRALASTKVLLNMCVALTLEMFLFLFVNTDNMSQYMVEYEHYGNCIALGAVLQYSILVLFMWMLVVALLQFQRYVTVIGISRPRHYILKSAILAWSLPLLPTLLVVLIAPKSYIPTEYQLRTDTGICYPSGHALVFGVVLPVSLIVLANLCIFVYVLYSVTHSLSQAHQRTEKSMILKQVRLYILLFFLLGLSWVFGFLAFIHAGIVFSYIFCLTATMQGFVLFVYFVLLDSTARNAWLNLLCPRRKAAFDKHASELQSMSTTSTNLGSGNSHQAQTRVYENSAVAE